MLLEQQHAEPSRVGPGNHKLRQAAIRWVPEIEGAEPCIYMEGPSNAVTPMCPGCYASKNWRVRNKTYGGKQDTAHGGLIRLGTWKEVLPHEWEAFKAGQGQRPDGTPWQRSDFKARHYFLVSRGLLPIEFYGRVADDPFALNIQISVEVIRTRSGSVVQIPPDEKLRQLVAMPKVVFRFKTLGTETTSGGVTHEANVADFNALRERVGIDRMRVLETPLRLGANRSYRTRTPLEAAGWDSKSFLRCNTECHECPSSRSSPGENRVLGCAVTPKLLELLRSKGKGNVEPARPIVQPRVKVPWLELVTRAWGAVGEERTLQEVYAGVERDARVGGHPHARAKIREVVQGHGVRVGPARWRRTE